MEQATTPTTRELQLELQVWNEHLATLQARGQLLQAQGSLLNAEAEKTQANIARLTALLTPKPAEAVAEPKGFAAEQAAPVELTPISSEEQRKEGIAA